MLSFMCVWIAKLTAFGLFVENLVGWALFFSPGWANGWPFGLSFHTVASIGIIVYILLELTTAAAGVGAIVGLICILLRVEEKYESLVYRNWRWVVIVLLCLSVLLFSVLA